MKKLSFLTLAALAGTLVPATGLACGGCFSPPTNDTQQIVVQNAERVLFWRNEATKTSYVWIEVVYAGLAKDFGWVLPVPKQPKVGVGTQLVFDALDRRMGARAALQSAAQENCRDPRSGCEPKASTAADAGAAAMDVGAGAPWYDAAERGPPKVPGVDVLDSGFTGPYEYAVIKGSDADKLHEWLTKAGYATPDKAKPILQVHATKGDVFVAIKLQNGQGINAIRPVTLEMPDAEPCVPLRLTSIAAQNDMTVTVTVAGTGRAVVKNHFDVVVNPLRLTLLDAQDPQACPPEAAPGAVCHRPKNYGQVLAAAIDEAQGHAFATEASLAGSAIGKLSPLQDLNLQPLSEAKTLLAVANFVAQTDLPLTGEIMTALQPAVSNAGPIFMQATQAEAWGALKACAKYWNLPGAQDSCPSGKLTLSKAKLLSVQANGDGVSKSLKQGIIDPLFLVGDAVGKATRATRLVLRISPDEMDRDPVFAFAPSLPEVAPVWAVQHNQVCIDGWSNGELRTRLTVSGLGSWLVGSTSIIDPLFAPTPAAMMVLVQEESGPPIPIGSSDLAVVDAAIAGALPGKPSLPAGLVLKPYTSWTPPPTIAPVTKVGNWKQPPDCVPKPGWKDGQPPPSGQAPDATTGAADAGTSGGPEVTASLDTKVTGPTTTAPGSGGGGSGCSSGPTAGSVWLALLAVAGAVGARRRYFTGRADVRAL
ncbi:MAG: DUF2330 domain-containing protein [Deltaproteobacteria bacterium]|nr:DUF2330 domain-containing protein [Deltaproteobacteria bacterium]